MEAGEFSCLVCDVDSVFSEVFSGNRTPYTPARFLYRLEIMLTWISKFQFVMEYWVRVIRCELIKCALLFEAF